MAIPESNVSDVRSPSNNIEESKVVVAGVWMGEQKNQVAIINITENFEEYSEYDEEVFG